MKTVKIPLSKLPMIEQYCFTARGEKYYLAYESNLFEPKSVLWNSLDFIKKHYSNEKGNVTKESLNVGRKHTLKSYELCLKHNCGFSELDKIDFKTGKIKTYVDVNGVVKPKEIQYPIYDNRIPKGYFNATIGNKEDHIFNKRLTEGLYVLCEIVND